MKICKLKLKNLNSFREEEVEIDFEKSPLDDVSLVAITGPTGSGKTTLLDAICVALYGKTPRLAGRESQHPRHLISHGETEGFAEVYFEANRTRYHATWSIKRKGIPKAQLFDDSGELITAKVAQEVESILGLDFGAFRRSVMLAQGEFAAFLKANNEERRTILEATAGVHIYDILREELNRKVSEVKAAYDEVIDRLKGIPEASYDQLKNAEAERARLHAEVETLGKKSRQIQGQKERESKRKEDFEKLQSSETRREELLAQQSEIDALRSELENANRAQRFLLEKQAFDTAQLEFKKSEEALRVATTEKTEAEKQLESHQTVYDEKAAAYQNTSTERDQKMPIHTAAKSDVERASERFAEADKRTPELVDVNNQIDALENQLTDRQTQQTELQGQIDDAQRFLEDNRLPLNRQQRLTKATALLAELGSQEQQLETVSTSKAQHKKKVLSLKREIENLSDTHEKRLSEKVSAETTLEDATLRLNKLQATGTHEEWTHRKQQAAKAQPIAQKYEAAQKDLVGAKNQLNELKDTATALDTQLEQIEIELANQTDVYQCATDAVQRCEAERESAKWADPINQLRQRLQPGEPCSVCGAIDHPCADVVEPENEELLQNAEKALADAKAEADKAQAHLQDLKTRQAQTEQNKRNTAKQIEDCVTEIETLRDEAAGLLAEWRVIYPNPDVSSTWTSEQFDITDTAIADITEAKQAHTKADNALKIAIQQLETCEKDIKREANALNDTETQLEGLNDTIVDLQADIAATAARFWEFLPDAFHGVTPKAAVNQFENNIEEVEARKGERDTAETQLQVLNANIEADQGTLQNLKDNREALKNEKDAYLREREAFLASSREKTGGLETEDEINKAIRTLEADLLMKENARDSAEQQLQNSQNLLTQKQAAHEFCEKQFNASIEKLDASRQVYFNKLKDAGFGTAEAHDNAFREDAQIQDLTDRIDTHEDGMQRLALEFTELQTRFEETPYDPDALEQIETQLLEIETHLQAKREEIGAQGEIIKGLKDALEKREELAGELDVAKQEMERWQQLHGIISKNALRDFALEIMFRQMGNLANEQLRYLTSDRYELKVETIGDLSVVDRWNANEERPVETLSGGESFLTSLTLALALSELSRGRAQLNSLFLDEGFGTLDSETLDTAIASLEGLRMQGRNIFLISHVQELTRRLPVKIQVNKKGNGSSSVKTPD